MLVFKILNIKACNAYVAFNQSLLRQRSPLLQAQVCGGWISRLVPQRFCPWLNEG